MSSTTGEKFPLFPFPKLFIFRFNTAHSMATEVPHATAYTPWPLFSMEYKDLDFELTHSDRNTSDSYVSLACCIARRRNLLFLEHCEALHRWKYRPNLNEDGRDPSVALCFRRCNDLTQSPSLTPILVAIRSTPTIALPRCRPVCST